MAVMGRGPLSVATKNPEAIYRSVPHFIAHVIDACRKSWRVH